MWTGNVPEYLAHLSTCRIFRNLLSQRHQSLQDMQNGDVMEQEDTIWTTSDVNAYHEARKHGDL